MALSERIYVDMDTEEGQSAWINAHPIERFMDEPAGRYFLIKRTPEYIAEVEQAAREREGDLT